ncbi:MAG: hypothetical protein HFH72_15715 [Lachnospiraceae bacterium]|nr:hypothetical protein [Lachnospiraceae bacterium]
MHTFETICRIGGIQYRYLHDNLPSLTRVSQYVERSNYYAGKGITQIELKAYEYPDSGIMRHEHYLVLRCNPSVIMGDSRMLLVDLEKYSAREILERLQHRLYEINQFRYIRLYRLPLAMFLARTAHMAVDIQHDFPQLIVWLCNMSFPYPYHRMERAKINKPAETLYLESCCFGNKSRRVNVYHKMIAAVNTGREIDANEFDIISRTVRLEIQLEKSGICNMKLPSKRSLEPFLDKGFCRPYVEEEIKAIFGTGKYVSRSRAKEIINGSAFKPYDKAVMLSVLDMIPRFKGLYELEKAIADESVHTPTQYGNIRVFKERWLKKFKQLGIQPATIPDIAGIDEIPSIYDLMANNDTYGADDTANKCPSAADGG